MEQYSLYGALRAKGLIKLKSRLPVILHTMIMIILSQKSITQIPRYILSWGVTQQERSWDNAATKNASL